MYWLKTYSPQFILQNGDRKTDIGFESRIVIGRFSLRQNITARQMSKALKVLEAPSQRLDGSVHLCLYFRCCLKLINDWHWALLEKSLPVCCLMTDWHRAVLHMKSWRNNQSESYYYDWYPNSVERIEFIESNQAHSCEEAHRWWNGKMANQWETTSSDWKQSV